MEQDPGSFQPAENIEIGPRLEDKLPPERMRRLVMVDALRQLNEDFLFFVPSEELTSIQTEALNPTTPEERRAELLDQWEETSRQLVDIVGAKDAATEIGRQIMSAANWLATGNMEVTRNRIAEALDYAGQMGYSFVPDRVNEMADAYWSDAFEDPTTPDSLN